MEYKSSKTPVLIGVLLIALIVGAIMLAIKTSPQTIDSTNTIAELPASTTPDRATSTTPVATTTTEWASYTDPQNVFTVDYQKTMTVKTDQNFPPAPGNDIKATVFAFPASDYTGGTIQDASVSIAATKTACSVWSDTTNKVPVTSTKTINGISFEYRILNDAGAGNFYDSYEYSTTQNNLCYRIVLFTHTINPGNVYQDTTTIDQKTSKNKEITDQLLTVFEHMISTFNFTK